MRANFCGSAVLLALLCVAGTAADFVYPRSVAVDGKGVIYVGDAEACTVFRLEASGGPPAVMVAGGCKEYRSPLYCVTGVAVTADGQLAVADTGASAVYRVV